MSICYSQVFVQNTFRILKKKRVLRIEMWMPITENIESWWVFFGAEWRTKYHVYNTANKIFIAIGYFHGDQCENIYRTNTNIFYKTNNCYNIYLTSSFKSFIHFLHVNACRHRVLIQLYKVKNSFISSN